MDDMIFKSAKNQIKLLHSRQISSYELTKAYLDRIEKYDAELNSFLYVNKKNALESAKSCDESISKMHENNKQYTNWKLHYCADFGEEHGEQCVAMFYVLVPSITLEPSDTVTQQWTILRAMN